MAVTYTLTPLGYLRSYARAVLISNAAAASEALTLVQNIAAGQGGICPSEIRFLLRSIITGASVIIPPPVVTVLNQSQATVAFGVAAANPASAALYDIVAEFAHSVIS